MKKSEVNTRKYRLCLFAAAFITACVSNPPTFFSPGEVPNSKVMTLIIASHQIDCEIVAKHRCMQVKRTGEKNFTAFHGAIDGFTFEEGNNYTLLVRVEHIENPPADRSAYQYSLIEMLKKEAESGQSNLEGRRWKLEHFTSPALENEALPENLDAIIEFQNGRFNGSGGCNRLFGTYTMRAPNELTIVLGGSTMMACPEPVMSLEKNYLLAIGQTKNYGIVDDRLELHAEGNRRLATYRLEQDASLVGPTWNLLSYNNGSGLESNRVTASIREQFDEKGRLAGFSGCNRYHARYISTGNDLTIENAATTRKICNQTGTNVMQVEQKYLAILPRVAAYSIQGKRLTLYGNNGSRLAICTSDGLSKQSAAISGSRNNGDD